MQPRWAVETEKACACKSTENTIWSIQSFAPQKELMKTDLDGVVSVQEHVFGTDAAVDAGHGHEQTETEEVTVVEMTHAVI